VGDLTRFDGCRPTKMILVAPPAAVSPLAAEMAARYGDRISMVPSNPEYLELLPQGVDKAFALAVIGRRLGIAASEMIAFGDGAHDAPMLAYAGLGIAMGNAPDDVKRSAHWVTGPSDEDGVAQAVERIFGMPAC